MDKYFLAFKFEDGTMGIATRREGSFAMLLVHGQPGEEVLMKEVFCFDSMEQGEKFIEDMKNESEKGRQLFEHFEGRYHILPGKEIAVN